MKRRDGDDPHQFTIDWTHRTVSTNPTPPQPLPSDRAVKAGRRVIARMPVPKPLPHAVAAGNFGQDERGPIRPSAAEVREITETHAALLIDLLAQQREAQRSRSEHESARLSAEIQTEIQKYAEDFGERAAEQLLAYSRRQGNAVPIGPAGRNR
jgi:hypothetical protein